MRKRPITIALVIAGVIAGTTAGIAAINSELAPVAQPVALQPAAEVQAPAESPVALETPAPVEYVAQAPAEVVAPVRVSPPPVVSAPVRPMARSTNDEQMVRIPFTNYYVRVTNPTFPSAGVELPEPLPATIAYFDQLEARRLAATQTAPVAQQTVVPSLDALTTTRPSSVEAVPPTTQAMAAGN
jgi:hypothetical protein